MSMSSAGSTLGSCGSVPVRDGLVTISCVSDGKAPGRDHAAGSDPAMDMLFSALRRAAMQHAQRRQHVSQPRDCSPSRQADLCAPDSQQPQRRHRAFGGPRHRQAAIHHDLLEPDDSQVAQPRPGVGQAGWAVKHDPAAGRARTRENFQCRQLAHELQEGAGRVQEPVRRHNVHFAAQGRQGCRWQWGARLSCGAGVQAQPERRDRPSQCGHSAVAVAGHALPAARGGCEIARPAFDGAAGGDMHDPAAVGHDAALRLHGAAALGGHRAFGRRGRLEFGQGRQRGSQRSHHRCVAASLRRWHRGVAGRSARSAADGGSCRCCCRRPATPQQQVQRQRQPPHASLRLVWRSVSRVGDGWGRLRWVGPTLRVGSRPHMLQRPMHDARCRGRRSQAPWRPQTVPVPLPARPARHVRVTLSAASLASPIALQVPVQC